jgi:hypothetical protein
MRTTQTYSDAIYKYKVTGTSLIKEGTGMNNNYGEIGIPDWLSSLEVSILHADSVTNPRKMNHCRFTASITISG